MAKKKQKVESVKQLSPEQYWRWSNIINEKWLAESQLKERELHLALVEKDLELLRMKIVLKRQGLQAYQDRIIDIQKSYMEYKQIIEKDLDVKLDGCCIDEITYEVKKLED